MDCTKIGRLILKLRNEKGLTQKELADIMNISDKAISKWERGMGCPDVSLLSELSQIFNVHIEEILSGDLKPGNTDGGNMKKIKFYMCPTCGNVITATGEADVACCGRRLDYLDVNCGGEEYGVNIETVENDYFITFSHEMSKDHFISFVAYVTYDSVILTKLYPEQAPQVRVPKYRKGKLYFACNQNGIRVLDIS